MGAGQGYPGPPAGVTRHGVYYSRSREQISESAVIQEAMQLDTDTAPAIAAHLDHAHIRVCTVVSRKWSRMFSSQQIWRDLFNRDFNAAANLITDCQDPATPICWRKEHARLNDLMEFYRPARPEIDPGSIHAVLEIRFDPGARFERMEQIKASEIPDEWKDPVVLRIRGFRLIDEESEVQPESRHRTCILRGEADSVDTLVVERLKASAEKCMLRTFAHDMTKGKVALLHLDDPHDGYLGVKVSDDQVSVNYPVHLHPPIPQPISLSAAACPNLTKRKPFVGAQRLISFDAESHSLLEHDWMYNWSVPSPRRATTRLTRPLKPRARLLMRFVPIREHGPRGRTGRSAVSRPPSFLFHLTEALYARVCEGACVGSRLVSDVHACTSAVHEAVCASGTAAWPSLAGRLCGSRLVGGTVKHCEDMNPPRGRGSCRHS
jgi:hypothetical protein